MDQMTPEREELNLNSKAETQEFEMLESGATNNQPEECFRSKTLH